jgi:kynureninase
MIGAADAEVALAASTSAACPCSRPRSTTRRRNRVVVADSTSPPSPTSGWCKPGVEVVRVPSDDGVSIDPERMADAIDERTAIVPSATSSSPPARIQQMAPIAEAARRHGAFFLLDAYQSAGQVPIDVMRSAPMRS